jgi:hypothetical protein
LGKNISDVKITALAINVSHDQTGNFKTLHSNNGAE